MINNIYGIRTDLAIERDASVKLYKNDFINLYDISNNKYIYHIIEYKDLLNKDIIKKAIKNEIQFFIKYLKIKKKSHIFIVGLGNENNTPDSIGSKVIKNIKVNSYYESIGINISGNKISALEPGVLGTTGIDTKRIIESVSNEIKPDLIILVDSYVSKNIDYLNKTIQFTNEGIIPGSGIQSLNQEISYKTLNIPIFVIGVPTAIESKFYSKEKRSNLSMLVSTKDVDLYVNEISNLISEALNEVL